MLKTPLENDVTEYYRSVYRSVIDAEVDTLDAVFDEGFTFTGLSGDESDKEEFLSNVWEDSFIGEGTLPVHIRHLREKIEINPNEPQIIRTVWGVGYIIGSAEE